MSVCQDIDLNSYREQEVFLSVKSSDPGPFAKPHVLIMIHGIRTNAEWMDDFIAESIICGTFKVVPVSYGRFSAKRFLFGNIDVDLYKDLLRQIEEIIRVHPGHNISVMAHSFGTKLFSEICDLINYRFHYIIFLGGVAKEKDARVASSFCSRLVNDFSKKDLWPKCAEVLSPRRFFACGTNAFHKHWVLDRPFRYNHSDYLTKSHFIEYILPLILNNIVIYPVYDDQIISLISRIKARIKYRL